MYPGIAFFCIHIIQISFPFDSSIRTPADQCIIIRTAVIIVGICLTIVIAYPVDISIRTDRAIVERCVSITAVPCRCINHIHIRCRNILCAGLLLCKRHCFTSVRSIRRCIYRILTALCRCRSRRSLSFLPHRQFYGVDDGTVLLHCSKMQLTLTAVIGIVIGLKQKINRISLSGQQINIHIV